MKKTILPVAVASAALMLLASCGTTGTAAKSAASANNAATAEAAAPDAFLAELTGTYEELFPAWRADEYADVWASALEKYADVRVEDAERVKDAFLSVYEAEVYGPEAEALAEADPSYFLFNCGFTGGVATLTFDGDTISGAAADGTEVFRHTYTYVATVKADFGPKTDAYAAYLSEEDWPQFRIYESDGPADEFKYFALGGDTPAETFHIEFRYGSDPDALAHYFTGAYGYWMASGVFADCSDEMMTNVINLFAEENADTIRAIAGTAE